MSHIEVDVPAEELIETPLIPSGTVVTVKVSAEPEIKVSNKNADTSYLNVPLQIVEARNEAFIGLTLFHIVVIPNNSIKARMVSEDKVAGWKMMCNNWAKFCRCCGIEASKADSRRMINKKFTISVAVDEYEGKQRNKVGDILDIA